MTRRCLLVLLACVAALAQPAPLIIVLLGPPGAGKGTQAKFITDNFRLPAISTGDLLRAEVKEATPLGQRIQATMARGQLVSDEIVNQLVAARIGKPDARGGFILDGYPRTIAQAEFLDRLASEKKGVRPLVLHLDVPDEEVIQRLTGRGRADDKPEVIRDRLKVYGSETRPLIDYYSKGNYHRIDGVGTPEEVWRRIERVLRAAR